ncbi:MAG: hypothetical protein R8K20_07090 [Gallionellaceae bacterium]
MNCAPFVRTAQSFNVSYLLHPNYVMVFLVTALAIEIINVLHFRQEYP